MITKVGASKTIDDFTEAGNGTIMDVSLHPMRQFTLLVKKTGAVTSWLVILEGSLDGVRFSQIAKHTDLIGDGESVFSGTNLSSCLYFRTRCSAITLGAGTKITAIALGVP